MKTLAEVPFPQSLGLYYAMTTQYLGFDFGEDEYKVMGLASYGRPNRDLTPLLDMNGSGYKLNTEMVRKTGVTGEPALSPQEQIFSDAFARQFGPPRVKESPVDSRHEDFAASAQRRLEDVVLALTRPYLKETNARHLCVAGGVAMNCVVNQRLAGLQDIDGVFVPPVAGDSGLALGAALEQAALEGEPAPAPLNHAAWGPEYTDDETIKACQEVGARYRHVNDPADVASELIARGKIIGWFQGRMEYGPRALGHRSILADPRLADMKDRVNAVVKFREGFRPFAPSVAEEHAHEYFQAPFHAPFMTFTFNVLPEARAKIPAVTHVDGTARIQIVRRTTDPLYHRVISEFGRRTGVNLLLNTSFNIKGQPIVENPYQALSTYFGSGLEALVIGNLLLEKA